ncbi:lactonase family protein [Cyclobacterium xiamenense]|nr:lactonase family protein [Cyclobacterium xiamenense]
MKRNRLLTLLLLVVSLACGRNQKTAEAINPPDMATTYAFLLGTYTELPEQGIHLVHYRPGNGGFEVRATGSEPSNPSFIVATKNQELAFCVEETSGADGGKVSSFRLSENGFSMINSVSSAGNGPCYLSLDPSEKFLIVGNYSQGNFAVIPVGSDGGLASPIQVIQHEGSSAHPRRQQQPHVHSAVFHPTDGRLLIADLGTDEVVVYNVNSANEKPLQAEPHFRLKVAPGAGPRHMVFNESADRLYLVHEITAEIGVYGYEDGELQHQETHSLLREGFEGDVGAAEVRLSPDGKHLYVSNRGDANELVVFGVSSTGLTHLQTVSSEGMAPRNFNLTPDGVYLLVGNQNSNSLLSFKRDAATGKITPTGEVLDIHKPVYINFLP